MTRLDALKALLKKVEAGELVSEKGTTEVWPMLGGKWQLCRNAALAASGSLDAAKALHEAVLPTYTRTVDASAPECGITVELHPVDGEGFPAPKPIISADCGVEARAWLICIIKALIAQEEGK